MRGSSLPCDGSQGCGVGGGVTPTQRTLKALRARGLTCAIVERWNPHVRIRQDLYGWIDILAIGPEAGIIGVQSTGQDFAGHLRKLRGERVEKVREWLAAGGKAELWGWRKLKVKRGGKAMVWRPRVLEITEEMLNAAENV